MKIGILGSGPVAKTLAIHLHQLGHEVMLSSRQPHGAELQAVLAPYAGLLAGTAVEAASHGELLINALNGIASAAVIKEMNPGLFAGKILVDLSNALDFSKGMPPELVMPAHTSVGEELQQLLPDCNVVKALNTVSVELMTNPRQLQNGQYDVFICGDDADAKQSVMQWLSLDFGWPTESFVDMGGIAMARTTEAILPLLLQIAITKGAFKIGLKAHY